MTTYDASEDPPVNPVWVKDYDREPKWKDLDDTDIEIFYDRVKDFVTTEGEQDNLDWSRLNFDVVDADFYRDKIGEGFPDEFYELLAKSTVEENKIQDYRQLPLNKVEGEIVLKMS